ncbi:MAG: flagellar hook capping FlgD N-terminal domain-containing protein [Acidimicrobiales bacterium]
MADLVTARAGATVPLAYQTAPAAGTNQAAGPSRLDASNFAGSSGSKLTDAQSSTLDKDAFLKLLVAQLKYQDPMQPSSSEEFIATTAQFTMVEKLDQLTEQGKATALVSSLTTASAMVGRSVSAIQDGAPVEAVVLRSKLVSGEVVLDTDKGVVHLNEIVSVGAPALTATPPTADPSSATPAPTPATEPQETPQP